MRAVRAFFILLIVLHAGNAFSQAEEIYRLTFSDTTNFKIMENPWHKRPSRILIMDTTQEWNTQRFWLENTDLSSPEKIKELENDEHSAYNCFYLFSDSLLNTLIDDKEKQSLSKSAGIIRSKSIALKGSGYATMHAASKVIGYYVVTTEPLFSSDGKYAFIDLTFFYNKAKHQGLCETYFAEECVIYERQKDNTWKKIGERGLLFL